jgi:hypothetical protein
VNLPDSGVSARGDGDRWRGWRSLRVSPARRLSGLRSALGATWPGLQSPPWPGSGRPALAPGEDLNRLWHQVPVDRRTLRVYVCFLDHGFAPPAASACHCCENPGRARVVQQSRLFLRWIWIRLQIPGRIGGADWEQGCAPNGAEGRSTALNCAY